MSEPINHTPGPWHVSRHGRYIRHAVTLGGETVHPNIADTVVFGGPEAEREANARLIAAAPELLEAARAWAERGWCVQGPKPKPGCACDWHMAKAAIAKAEGR